METITDYTYPTLVNAAFANQADAQRAYDELIYRGYKPDEVNVIVSDETHRIHHAEAVEQPGKDSTMEKAGIGGAIGGAAGAIAGVILAIGTTVVIPGLGIAVAGPLLAGLTGAGAGGITGGIVGALHGKGIPKEHAEAFETSIRAGGVIISFTPKTVEDRMEIVTAWKQYGAQLLHGNETYTA